MVKLDPSPNAKQVLTSTRESSRRKFIRDVVRAGGSVYAALSALGYPQDTRPAPRLDLPGAGDGEMVLILGAGLAGLCAAFELEQRGYVCQILEADDRPGGRARTIRNGDRIAEAAAPQQVADFPTTEYFNAGAGRVPQHHITIDYYRKFGISIETFSNINSQAFLYDGMSRTRLRNREATYDLRGWADELASKCVSRAALDAPMTRDDVARVRDYLKQDGELDGRGRYRGGLRRGPASWGDTQHEATPSQPLQLAWLLARKFGTYDQYENDYEQQPVMVQPVGGIDVLPKAFAMRLRPRTIEYNARVVEIRKHAGAARVLYVDSTGAKREHIAPICICTIPLSVLRRIPNDFSAQFAEAISAVHYEPSTKVALHFKRRFWEEDNRIFSGITYTDLPITMIWYPAYGFFRSDGVLVGAYNFLEDAARYGKLAPDRRVARAVFEGSRIHAQYRTEYISGVSVAWQNMPLSLGAWAAWDNGPSARAQYSTLRRFDGPYILAGEHLSHKTGWQAGALESARAVVAQVHARLHATRRS